MYECHSSFWSRLHVDEKRPATTVKPPPVPQTVIVSRATEVEIYIYVTGEIKPVFFVFCSFLLLLRLLLYIQVKYITVTAVDHYDT